jgi:Flp pilus assembly protein TadG
MFGKVALAKAGEERGQGLVLGTLAMVVIMAFTAMAIDVGLFLHEKRELQKAADAAALAGAQELPNSPETALVRAGRWALSNGIGSGEIDSVDVTTTYATDDTLTVKLKRDVPFVFARVLGFSGDTMKADGTARVGSPAAVAGLAPFGVLEDAISVDEPTVLKYDAKDVTQGNFGPLGIDGPGADVYRETIERGSETALCSQSQASCADPTAQTETGNMVGPTRQGMDWRLDNTPPECDEFEEVFHEVGGTYRLTSQCNPFPSLGPDQGSRVVIVPVIDELCAGSCTVTIVNFAIFFIDELGKCVGNDCEVTGRFVDAQADIGSLMGSYDPDGLLHFVRLVE